MNGFTVAGSLFHICFSGPKVDCDVDLELPSGNAYCSEWNLCGYIEYEPPENPVSESSTDESTGVEDPEAGFVGDYIDSTASAESEDSSISEGENGHNAEMPSDFEVSSISGESGDET